MLPERYTVENIRNAVREPFRIQREARKINHQLNRSTLERRYDGVDFVSEDWDNLIILDACRHDYFANICDISGELRSLTSVASNTWEFVRKTFGERSLRDTIYITGNAHFEKLPGQTFFRVERFLTQEDRLSPDQLVDRTIEMHERHPRKRLITHLIHPHAPYTSPKAERLRQKITDKHGVSFALSDDEQTDPDGGWDLHSLLTACERGYLSRGALREVYRQELEIGLEHAATLADELDGKTVITADHGELLGDRLAPLFIRDYGHYERVYCDPLRTVPWLVVDGDRRTIEADEPMKQEAVGDDVVTERLQALGYTE